MTGPTPDREALDTAKDLTGMLGGVREELAKLNKRLDKAEKLSHRSWVVIIFTVASLAADLALTGLFIANNVKLDHTTSGLKSTQVTLAQLRQSNVSACQSGNVARAQQEHALDAVLAPFGAGPATAQQKMFLARARADIARGWSPRNCKALYKQP